MFGRAALGIVLLGPAVGCSGPSGVEGDIPDRETFIAVYVDLRLAAIAQTAYEEAAMWAVKMATAPEKK